MTGIQREDKGFRLSERPSAEMSSVQALMELALPRFTMSEGIRGKHSPWPVAKEVPASPSPNRNELTVKDPRCSSTQQVIHSVYFDIDALASSSEDELVDAKKCKDLSVIVLYKPEEYDTPAESKMSASDFVNRLESGAGDVRKVVRKPERGDGQSEGATNATTEQTRALGTDSRLDNRKVHTREDDSNSFSLTPYGRHDS